MFKLYLIEWLNNSGHHIKLYCSFRQNGIAYDIDYNNPQKSIITEPSSSIGEIIGNILNYDYEDTAVTEAFVYLGILKYKNAPITEKQLKAYGLKIQIEYPLDVQYRNK